MRNRLLPALPALLLALAPSAGAAQTTLQLRWELVGDSIANDWGASRAAFTLTNRSTKALPSSGWAIYFNALHSAVPGSVGSGFIIEDVIADLHRLAPAAGFAGLAPGASIRIPYLTGLLLNRSFVPQGPYIVFDEAKDVGVLVSDYVALPFERPPQGAGHDPRVVTPENQFTLDSVTRAIPTNELPPVFPTPVEVTAGAGTLRLTALPPVEAAEVLKAEAAFAAEYLRPYFGSTRKAGGPTVRLEVGPVAGRPRPRRTRSSWIPSRVFGSWASRPPASFTVSSRCVASCPRPLPAQVWSCRPFAWWTLRASVTAGSCSTSRGTSIRSPPCYARSTSSPATSSMSSISISRTTRAGESNSRPSPSSPPWARDVAIRPIRTDICRPRSARGPPSIGPGAAAFFPARTTSRSCATRRRGTSR